MTDSETLRVDVVIFGGGVAGLWLLSELRRAGYSTLLLEDHALGFGQTRYAQGIIHGGTKYALAGKLTASSQAIVQMPDLWRDCLAGKQQPDLSAVKVLSPHQYMWSTSSLSSRMAGFFGSRIMRSRTRPLDEKRRPTLFQSSKFRGQVYQLEEPVLDTASLVHALADPLADFIRTYRKDSLVFENDECFALSATTGGQVCVQTQKIVLTAGKGNQELLRKLGRSHPAMQLRPLKMLILRGKLPDGVYAHCLGASVNPRVTITSHYDSKGEIVWYLGGQLAEEGIHRSDAEQIEVGRKELASVLPWYDFSGTQFATLDIDRAEPLQADGKRPDDVFVHEDGTVITAWPTKLAFAPRLSQEVMKLIQKAGLKPELETGLKPGNEEKQPKENQPKEKQSSAANIDFAPLPWQEEETWR